MLTWNSFNCQFVHPVEEDGVKIIFATAAEVEVRPEEYVTTNFATFSFFSQIVQIFWPNLIVRTNW